MPNGPLGRVVALDVGSHTIGVAVSDEGRYLASPVRVIRRQAEGYRKDLAAVTALLSELGAVAVVVGLPLSIDGSVGPSAVRSMEFAERLRQASGLPVELEDERFSTVQADEFLLEGRSKRKRSDIIDAAAAAVFLQAYLDRRRAGEG